MHSLHPNTAHASPHRLHNSIHNILWRSSSVSTTAKRLSLNHTRSTASEVGKIQTNDKIKHAGPKDLPPMVEELLNSPTLERPAGVEPHQLLAVTEAFWKAMKKNKGDPGPDVVHRHPGCCLPSSSTEQQLLDYDVVVSGGTLGIFAALTLQQQGHRVCIIEKRILQGRKQEWNISRAELQPLITLGLLTHDEVEQCIATEWEQNRIAMKGGKEIFVKGVLNIGISPERMLDILKHKFVAAGGTLLERTAFKAAQVYDDGVTVQQLSSSDTNNGIEVTPGDVNRPMALENNNNNNNHGTSNNNKKKELTCRLLVDCMGHYSPIVKQIRAKQQPDGMVIVLGGAHQGVSADKNTTADLIYTFKDASDDMQLFWEAFPSDGGKLRTTYMFTYSDLDEARPSFTSLLELYLKLLPEYQGVDSLEEIKHHRVLFGGFPCYMKGSPLKPVFDRVLQIGDASAAQSPLSFGGFGAMIRHLPRLSEGIHEALEQNKLDKKNLGWLHPYQPSLSLAWLFQRAMSIRVGQLKKQGGGGGWLPVDQVNRLMRCNFAVLSMLGDTVTKSFLGDSMKLIPLSLTMLGMSLRDAPAVTRVLFQVGPLMILGWFRHAFFLTLYTFLYLFLKPVKALTKNFAVRRFVDALQYGSAAS